MTSFKDISYFNAEHLLVIVTLYWLVYWDSKEFGNPDAFTFRSVRVFSNKCLDRKTFEGTVDIQMNSGSEFKQPAVQRVVATRTLPDTELTVNSGRGDGEGLTSLRAEVKRLNILLVSIAIVVTDNSRCSGLGQ